MLGHPAALPAHWINLARQSYEENAMPPMVNDVPMSDETFADFTDAIKIAEAKGRSRAEAIDEIIAKGLKTYAKPLAEFRAFAAKQGALEV